MSLPVDDLIGRDLRDSDDQPIGKITAVYQYPTDMNAMGSRRGHLRTDPQVHPLGGPGGGPTRC
jgi:hypothetical protein